MASSAHGGPACHTFWLTVRLASQTVGSAARVVVEESVGLSSSATEELGNWNGTPVSPSDSVSTICPPESGYDGRVIACLFRGAAALTTTFPLDNARLDFPITTAFMPSQAF
jgi:hypothetical protein